ncbi:glycosyltransferase family 39 protein [bacterium]|nr:glycosyltransferase family 39 protein [bacterium]
MINRLDVRSWDSGRAGCQSKTGVNAIGVRTTSKQADALRAAVTRLTPVWPNLPPAETFLPAVGVLVLLLPASVAWLFGTLTHGQAIWGLLGLEVLQGDPLLVSSTNVAAPPFFAWCTAATLAYSFGNPIWWLTIPSYVFWILSAIVIFLLVQRWHDTTTALLTLIVLAVNPVVISQIQHGQPGTAALFWGMLTLWAYVEHLQAGAGIKSWWTVLEGISIGFLILTAGLSSLWIPGLIAIHLAYDQIQNNPDWGKGFDQLRQSQTLQAGLVAIAIALIMAAPWLAYVQTTDGPMALVSTSGLAGEKLSFDAPAVAMPTTIALGLFGIARAFRLRLRRQADRQASLPVIWVVVAYFVFLFIEPTGLGLLFVIVPLSILAMQSLEFVVERRLRDWTSLWIMIGTLGASVFFGIPTLTENVLNAIRKTPAWLTGELEREQFLLWGWEIVWIMLAFMIILGGAILVYWLFRKSSKHDRYRRLLLGSFAIFVVGGAAALGTSPFVMSKRSADPWIELDETLRNLPKQDYLVFLGERNPSPELAFIARDTARQMTVKLAHDVPELDSMLDRLPGKPLVLLTDPTMTLPTSIPLNQGKISVTFGRVYRGESTVVYVPVSGKEPEPILKKRK